MCQKICGETWLNYLSNIGSADLKLVESHKGSTRFKLGSGLRMQSLKLVKIPELIGSKKVFTKTDVVRFWSNSTFQHRSNAKDKDDHQSFYWFGDFYENGAEIMIYCIRALLHTNRKAHAIKQFPEIK